MNLLDQLFGSGSRPIRRDAAFLHKTDGAGNSTTEAVEGSAITLGHDGSINSARIVGFFHCGHVTTDGIGGKCAEPGCSNVSCKHCFAASRCAACFKPLCLEHLKELGVDTMTVRLCLSCHAAASRRLRWRRGLSIVFSPFVTFNEKSPR